MTDRLLPACLAWALLAAPAAAQAPSAGGGALHPPDPGAVTPSLDHLLREEFIRPEVPDGMAADAGEWFDRGGTAFRTGLGVWRPGAIRVDTDGVGVWTRDGRQPVMFFGDRSVVHHRVQEGRSLGRWRWLALAGGLAAAGVHHFTADSPRKLHTAAWAASGIGLSVTLHGLRGRDRYYARLMGLRGRGIDLRVARHDRSRLVWALEQLQRQNERRWRERMMRRSP